MGVMRATSLRMQIFARRSGVMGSERRVSSHFMPQSLQDARLSGGERQFNIGISTTCTQSSLLLCPDNNNKTGKRNTQNRTNSNNQPK